MANAKYAKGNEKLLSGDIALDSDTIKCALVSSAYTADLAADEFYSDISDHVVDTPETLTNKSITGGVFDADDPTFTAVATGPTVKAVVIYKDTGVAGTSPLLDYFDNITGFPFAANGSDVTIRWSNGANKIFRI